MSRPQLPSLTLIVAIFLIIVSSSSVSHSASYDFWDAQIANVSLPNRFVIDSENQVIILAAKNSICHISMDLSEQDNVWNVTPNDAQFYECSVYNLRDPEVCQNFQHVLLLPSGPGVVTADSGAAHHLNSTVLVCGSNAFAPICQYRERTNLTVIQTYTAQRFCPFDGFAATTSLALSTGQIISGTPLDIHGRSFGLTMSASPYNGHVEVITKEMDNAWFNQSPDQFKFVSMYEVGEYVYVFFVEEAIETSERVLYARVARVCKNDTGAQVDGSNIFTTFLKARMSCTASRGTSDITYHYNNLQDTYLVDDGSSEVHLYAIFTSPANGPEGSAVCVYTFGSHDNDLERVFNGDYLRRTGPSTWVVQDNFNPFTCASGRSAEMAQDIQLMESIATQPPQNQPVLQLPCQSFRKIVIDHVTDLNGSSHEVMHIASHRRGQMELLKVLPTSSVQQVGLSYHIAQTISLGTDSEITQMKLYGTGANSYVYLGTESGIFRVSGPNCEMENDCCSCISSRNPYCAYDFETERCVAINDTNRESPFLVQDVISGDSQLCASLPEAAVTPATDDGDTTRGNNDVTPVRSPSSSCGGERATASTPDVSVATRAGTINATLDILTPETPSVSGLSPVSRDHTWTVVGAVVSFIGGMALGIVTMAIFRSKRKCSPWNKYVVDHQLEESGRFKTGRRYRDGRIGSADNYFDKEEAFTRNNNEYTSVTRSMNSQRGDNHFKFEYQVNHPTPASSSSHICTDSVPILKPVSIPIPPISPEASSSIDSCSKACAKTLEDSDEQHQAFSLSYPPPARNPNIKTDTLKREVHLTNREREFYGSNLARTPSFEASTSKRTLTWKLSNTRHKTPEVEPVAYSARREFVEIHDVEIGSSQC